MRREEKRREFHEALLRTLYPPPSSPSPPPSPPPSLIEDEPFDVTRIDPEDYVNIGSSDCEKGEEGFKDEEGDESETAQKLSRAQRKRIRKKMLKEEAVYRRRLIGPLLPSNLPESRGAGADDHSNCEVGGSDGEGNGEQCVRGNAQEKEEKSSGRDDMGKVKKRRGAKKLAREISKDNPVQVNPS